METKSQGRPRVLIVDDQQNWLDALCDMLDPSSYEIEAASTYEQARLMLRQRAFHVLVSDQRLVDADKENIQGILLLDELKELQDGTQAIIVTGYPTIDAAKKALMGRKAHDYILKHPEEGGPFNISKYREQVREAANVAMGEWQGKIVVELSRPELILDLTYDQMARILFRDDGLPDDALDSVKTVLDWLLYPFQPLARGMSKKWASESDQMCEFFLWSRECGQPVLVRIGREHSPLEGGLVKWVTEKKWCSLNKKERHASGSVLGVSYAVDSVAFEEFAALVGEG